MVPAIDRFARYRAPHEVKFLLSTEQAAKIRLWASEFMQHDPHTAPELDHAYRVKSIYLDTPALHVYHREGSYARGKFRVRQYSPSGILFLERKMKTRGMVRKRRTTIQPHDLERLHDQPQKGWEGFWYHRRVNLRGLQPICAITYLRFAFLALQSPEPLRLTIDEDLTADRANQFHLTRELTGTSLLPEKSILELKYVGETPMLFKALVDTFHLTPEPVSKYRLAVPSLGLAPKLPTPEIPAVTPHSSLVCS